ncbi:MAG: hypothetical protein ACHQJ6_04605 [Candidatus Berkiellales bacterium]
MPEPDDKEKDQATASDRTPFKKPKKIKLTPQESGEPAPAVQQQVPPVQQSTAQKLAAAAARELAPEVSELWGQELWGQACTILTTSLFLAHLRAMGSGLYNFDHFIIFGLYNKPARLFH